MDSSHRHHNSATAIKSEKGATLVEFTIVFLVFLVFILAIIEFALVIYDASRLAEATRAGARFAIVNDPACNIFGRESNDAESGCSPNNHTLDCANDPDDSVSVEIDSCTFPATTDHPGCMMVEAMDQIMLRDSSTNSVISGSGKVTITYTCSSVGDPNIPSMVPVVTVSADDVVHPMMFTSIFGFYSDGGNPIGPTITLPSQKTSRTGEDMFSEIVK